MARKKILTLDQLVQFCKEQKLAKFSSEDSGYSLAVRIPAMCYESEDSEDSLLFTTVKVCHTELNRNGSYISEANMKKALKTLAYKPVLASFITNDDGELDFNSHDMEFTEDEDGNVSIEYIEQPVGAFTVDKPTLEYDKDADKTYVVATAAIPRNYTKAAEIIERKNGTKVSCELSVSEMSYNAKEKYLELTDFSFEGVTLLGEHVAEGMQGARLDIKDFSVEPERYALDEKLVEMLETLNTTLSNFDIDKFSRKEVKPEMKLEELLEKYSKTVEDLDFEYEDLSDEELEALFAEKFDDDAEPDAEEELEVELEAEPEPEADIEPQSEDEEAPIAGAGEDDDLPESDDDETDDVKKIVHSVTIGDTVKEFAVSLSDKINALSELVNDAYADDLTWYCVDVYEEEKYVVMHDYWGTGKSYKQSFKVKKDSYTLTGDRVEVFAQYLTADEIAKLDEMRSNYSAVSEKLAKYEAEPQKQEILDSQDYSYISDTEEFSALVNDHFDLSVEDVKAKADEILLNAAKSGALKFSAETEKKAGKLPLPEMKKKTSRYGNLFSK